VITGIILASGLSRRFGEEDKLLFNINKKTLIEQVCENAAKSNLGEIILVYSNYKIGKLIQNNRIIKVYNDNPQLGMSNSLSLGIKESSIKTKGYLFLLGDQPYIDEKIINEILMNFKDNSNSIIVPVFNGLNSNPVLFSNIFKNNLLNIKGDKGGRDLINKFNSSVVKINFKNNKNKDIDYKKDLKKSKS